MILVTEMCELLGVTVPTLYRYMRLGHVPEAKKGSQPRGGMQRYWPANRRKAAREIGKRRLRGEPIEELTYLWDTM